jgi:hypothetical protein
MMGRIVFLYFIQKKGWLAVPKTKNGAKATTIIYLTFSKILKTKMIFIHQRISAIIF